LITDNKVTTFLQADSNTTSNLPPTDHEWPLCDQTDHYVTTMWPLCDHFLKKTDQSKWSLYKNGLNKGFATP
jgi:hypothetical protein